MVKSTKNPPERRRPPGSATRSARRPPAKAPVQASARRAEVRRASASTLAHDFVAESRRRLRDEYLPKIRRALRALDDEDLWWRPNASSNSAGHLLLHLEGNVRQWILHGVAGHPDVRRRDAEFAPHARPSRRALMAQLSRTLREVDAVLARLHADDLRQHRLIQGYDISVLQAVYHVVEHFSGHTGQILYVAKQRSGRDLDLYPHLKRGARKPRRRRAFM